VLRFDEVGFVRGGRAVLAGIDWQVRPGERWVVLGPNGAGKSSLIRLAATYELPTSGTVSVLGHRVGTVDLRRAIRPRIGLVGPDLERDVAADSRALDAVVMGADATLRRWRQAYTAAEWGRARGLLDAFGCGELAAARFGRLSDGERRRVLLARALMPEPSVLLFDEPCANLDLGGREQVVGTLERLAAGAIPGAIVLVTHHLEEIPQGATHALLLRAGRVLASGPIWTVLDSAAVSACFGTRVEVVRDSHGRWRVTGAGSGSPVGSVNG
jgi:iron complex transport system ATP-binding protein